MRYLKSNNMQAPSNAGNAANVPVFTVYTVCYEQFVADIATAEMKFHRERNTQNETRLDLLNAKLRYWKAICD